jgi:hypothetical protein
MQPVFSYIEIYTVLQCESTRCDLQELCLSKTASLCEELNDANAKLYSPLQNLSVDEVIVPFRERFIFKQNIPKKQMLWYKDLKTARQDGLHSTYDISIHFGKDR